MASPSENSSSSRSTATLMPGRIVIVCDATKNLNCQECKHIITNIQMHKSMIQEVDTITVLGVLHKVLHPMGFQMQIGPDSFIGTRVRAIKEEVSRMVDSYVRMLQLSAEECEGRGVVIEVKIVVGAPLKKVVVQEVVASNATWVVLNRQLKKELRFYLKHIPCKVAMSLDNYSVEVLRPYYSDKATADTEHELFYSLSKIVPLSPAEYNTNNEQYVISPSYRGSLSSHESSDSEKSSSVSSLTSKSKEQSLFSPDESETNPHLEQSGRYTKDKDEYDNSPPVTQKQSVQSGSKVAVHCTANEMKSELESRACKYSEKEIAADGFSSDNLLGEDEYGVVYRGQPKDGELIAVKVQKEANTSKLKEQSFFSQDEFGPNPHLEQSASTGRCAKDKHVYDNSPPAMQAQSLQSDSKVTFLRTANEMGTELDSRACNHSEIEIAADGFSSSNLLEKDTDTKVDGKSDDSYLMIQKQSNLQLDSDASYPSDEMKMRLDCKGFNYSEIQVATNDFSSDNLLGEDVYGVVYKGRLKDGKLIAVKVLKEANTQGFPEFHSQVCLLSLVCHRNVVMLLGYCHRENINILVYEYICNRSLEWHLFENTERALEWHQRHAIAIAIAKGLRFLHEECRGSPIIHRDLRPSNVFLTHEFVPLLENCGLSKWKTKKYDRQSKILETLEYLAPEYAENGICSVKTDVFAFGIILIQLISGRKGVDSVRDNHHESLRQWAMPLIQTLALDELVDPRLGDSYSTYELYQMAKVAYLCIQTKSATRPTMGEVLHILEGKNEHLNHITEQLILHSSNVQKPGCLQASKV